MYDQGDDWVSVYLDQLSDFGDHLVQIVQWLRKVKIANFNIGGFDQGNHWLSDYPDQWWDFGDHLVQIV